MSTEHSTSWVKHLCRYSVASGDMYYNESGLRDVILRTNEQGDFRIRGEMVGGDPSEAIELCQIFLEYAMCCCAWCSLDMARYHMQDFAQHMGRSVGEFLKENTCLFQSGDSTDLALEHLFQTMNAHVSIKSSGKIEDFVVTDCPLETAAEHSGLRDIELAHHGINVMCQNMIQAVNPEVILRTSPEICPEFAFTILKPEYA